MSWVPVTTDSLVKSLKTPYSVIPVKTGIQFFQVVTCSLDSGFRRNDDFLRECHDWVMAQKPEIDPQKWISHDDKTQLYDLERARVTSTVERQYRIILVIKEQEPFPGLHRKKAQKVHYAIVENLPLRLDPVALYQFYCGRQTIENFFKEAKGPFNAGKMPSERFRACEAYLQFCIIAYNLFEWFKKNFSPRNGKAIRWRPFES